MEFSERNYIIIVILSAAVAISLFYFGEGTARVFSLNEKQKFGVQASGAFAGFLLIFLISPKIINKLENIKKERRINLKLYLNAFPEGFIRNNNYICKYWLFNEETGDDPKEFVIGTKFRWEAGYLTLDIKDVSQYNRIKVRVEQMDKRQNKVWESDYFHSRAPIINLNYLDDKEKMEDSPHGS